jgi:hypothetical protein
MLLADACRSASINLEEFEMKLARLAVVILLAVAPALVPLKMESVRAATFATDAIGSTLSIPKNKLSQKSVLALMLLLLSEEEQKTHAALQSLYEANYVSTPMVAKKDIDRYLISMLASRYKGSSSKAVFAALVKFEGVIATAFKKPAAASLSNLRSQTVRVAVLVPRSGLDQFKTRADDWLNFIQEALSKSAELNMIQLQSLVSQRQQAVQITTNLIAALADSYKQVIGNVAAEPRAEDDSGGDDNGGSSSCPPCGCSCP